MENLKLHAHGTSICSSSFGEIGLLLSGIACAASRTMPKCTSFKNCIGGSASRNARILCEIMPTSAAHACAIFRVIIEVIFSETLATVFFFTCAFRHEQRLMTPWSIQFYHSCYTTNTLTVSIVLKGNRVFRSVHNCAQTSMTSVHHALPPSTQLCIQSFRIIGCEHCNSLTTLLYHFCSYISKFRRVRRNKNCNALLRDAFQNIYIH